MTDNSAKTRKADWLSAVALAALVAGGAAGGSLLPAATPAQAQMPAAVSPGASMPSFADVVDRVKPAVVSVRVQIKNVADRSDDEGAGMPDVPPGSPMERFFRQYRGEGGQRFGNGGGENGPRQRPGRGGEAQGSGFFISADGYVVTNNHVVDNASTVEVKTDDGRTLQAKVVGTDPKTDLAVLKVQDGGSFPFVPLAARTPRVGDWVVAIGNPFGLGGTVTAGIVSARGRDIGAGPYDDFLQIDAPVNRGNSGGPTFNLNGEVVGINTAIASPSGGSVGIAFAIPADEASKVIASLRENGSVARGFVGVQIQPVTKEIAEAIGLKEPKGALVAEAIAGSPAEKAGIRTGDTIVAVNGETVREAKDLSRKIAAFPPGKSVTLTVFRDGKDRAVSLEIGRQNGA